MSPIEPTDLDTSFDEALVQTAGSRRHLLLGNGFSRAAYKGFQYVSLLKVDFNLYHGLSDLFCELGTQDFESAMAMALDAETCDRIRDAFVTTISWIHPRRDEILPRSKRAYCAEFLSHFISPVPPSPKGKIFTTNYDLLLCWIIVEQGYRFGSHDGFDAKQNWNPVRADRSDYYYLHGALHLYRGSGKPYQVIRKHKAGPINVDPLPDQVRRFFRDGYFPRLSQREHGRRK